MNSWITRLFGLAEEKPEASVEAEDAEVVDAVSEADVATTFKLQHAADINAIFYKWLIGQNAVGPMAPSAEKLILDEIAKLANSPQGGSNLVPRVPAVIPQLLKSLRDENVSATQLARQITHDVVLVAEVIHEANSPFYHPVDTVTNIEKAVNILGQNGLRLLIAKVSFRPIINLQSGHFTKVVAPHIWAQSEYCAEACSIMARECRADPFEAFLAGLMQNVGMIVSFRLIDQIFRGKSLPSSDSFCYTFTELARKLSAGIARQWQFPPNVVQALEYLLQPESVGQLPLAEALFMGDQVSKIRMLIDHRQLAEEEHFVASGLTPSATQCLERLKTNAANR